MLILISGCRYKGKCYNEGDTRQEGCVTKTCAADGTWVISIFSKFDSKEYLN